MINDAVHLLFPWSALIQVEAVAAIGVSQSDNISTEVLEHPHCHLVSVISPLFPRRVMRSWFQWRLAMLLGICFELVIFMLYLVPDIVTCSIHEIKKLNPFVYTKNTFSMINLFLVSMIVRQAFLSLKYLLYIWAPSQYKDRLIYVWRFPC